MSKASLIALVATAVIVNGERQVIQPGQPLPELKPADHDALLAVKAARQAAPDTTTAATADKSPGLEPGAGADPAAPDNPAAPESAQEAAAPADAPAADADVAKPSRKKK